MRHDLRTQLLRSNISDDAGELHAMQAEPISMAAATAVQPCHCAEGLDGSEKQATAASSEPEPGTEPRATTDARIGRSWQRRVSRP